MRSEEVAARALKLVGDDRYKLALAVAKRAEALAGGAKSLLDIDVSKMKFADIALREIAEGKVALEGIVEAAK
ncbi:DNA-directed RNA polymerase, omega subunit [Campylobacter rectus RM3267]|uniref:DNA-directed RNA polymerase subunit omega n=2 Tax=Campylobacter rectus TaxID=203 RepID=A0A6G5QNR2_CAMRE|nr:DNA-directed RNA polymerase subunit omega [Campylobacter rectus]EEF13996.1 DNA-directed RNA polymerase, omega subunit [Campylobacter rectus RM3267]QCD47237.1 DNA-directed RNA polymerase, omega subunit [Campylobacter rectus]RRD54388.1 DNA-directed RNA polymerase subunit omega [Campylobacter rectus]UEB47931.1 DNA-directed RNA polymerase subunit omega [Campylobacter rectus]